MAIPTHFRFTFRGHFEGTPEFWSFGLHYARTVSASPDANVGDINESGVTSAIDTFMDNAHMGALTRLDDWRAYQIGTDGRAEGDILIHTVDPGAPIAGAGGQNYPTQIAVAVTTVSDNRGPAKLGRFYLPALAMPLSTGGRMAVADVTALLDTTADFLKGISDAIDLPSTTDSAPCVNVSTRGGSAGTIQDVDHIRIGRVFDTLRSRRRSMDEDYQEGGQIDW